MVEMEGQIIVVGRYPNSTCPGTNYVLNVIFRDRRPRRSLGMKNAAHPRYLVFVSITFFSKKIIWDQWHFAAFN